MMLPCGPKTVTCTLKWMILIWLGVLLDNLELANFVNSFCNRKTKNPAAELKNDFYYIVRTYK